MLSYNACVLDAILQNGGWEHFRTEVITLKPRQDGHHFPDDIFNCIFMNEDIWISIYISLKLVANDQFNNIPALVQIMAWHQPGNKPLSEPMMVSKFTNAYLRHSTSMS